MRRFSTTHPEAMTQSKACDNRALGGTNSTFFGCGHENWSLVEVEVTSCFRMCRMAPVLLLVVFVVVVHISWDHGG